MHPQKIRSDVIQLDKAVTFFKELALTDKSEPGLDLVVVVVGGTTHFDVVLGKWGGWQQDGQ